MKNSAKTIVSLSPTINEFCLFLLAPPFSIDTKRVKNKRKAYSPADSSLPHSIHNSCKRRSFLLLGNLLLNTVLHFKFDTMAGS
jgi:hypothetical protein